MKPEDVWVVFDKASEIVTFVSSEKFVAERAMEREIEFYSKIYSNKSAESRLEVVTLKYAITKIHMNYTYATDRN